MSIGIVGRKCGMSRIFTESGESVPVTLIEATPNRVVQVKTLSRTATPPSRLPLAPSAPPC